MSEEKIAEFTAHVAALGETEPMQALRKGIELEETISKVAGKLGLYASLCQSANTRDPEAASQLGRLMAVYSSMAAPEAAFQEWASKLPNLMELVEADDDLKDYRFMFNKMQKGSRYLLEGRGEEIMARHYRF